MSSPVRSSVHGPASTLAYPLALPKGASLAIVVPVLVAAGLAAVALLAVVVCTLKDFTVLLGADPGSPLRWILPGIIGAVAVGGLLFGRVLKCLRPETHARIGLGTEAFRLDKAASE